MITNKAVLRMQPEELGIFTTSVDEQKQRWRLSNILIHAEPAPIESGVVIFIACNKLGIPLKDVEFIIVCQDIITYPVSDCKGRFIYKLDHSYSPSVGSGPYWGGFSEGGIAPDVHGFGRLIGYSSEVKIIFSQL